METLSSLFVKEKSDLRDQLNKDRAPNAVISSSRLVLDRIQAEYAGQENISPTVQRVSAQAIDITKASLSSILAASETEVLYRKKEAAQSVTVKQQVLVTSGARLGLIILLIVTAGTGLVIVFAVALLVIMLWQVRNSLKSLGIFSMFRLKRGNNEEVVARNPIEDEVRAFVRVNIEIYLRSIHEAVTSIDQLILATVQLSKQSSAVENPIVNDMELLDFFHDMLEAYYAADAVYALKKSRTIAFLLEQRGLKIQSYLSDMENPNSFFNFEESVDGDKTIMIRPALVDENGNCKRKGLVLLPAA